MPAAALPEAFEARMRELLGPEAPAFLASYRRPAERAVRANPLKLDPAALPGLLGIEPEPVPWCREAFFLPQGARVGGTLAHAAGLCYVQEPSALAVGEALDVRPGQRVIDLAAAPGGKATLAAGRLGGRGVVVANEVQRGRVQALADNLDRWGSDRTVLAGETVARLAERLPASFDRVLLDAPCSGEGLFRRNPAAAAQWRPGHVRGSAERQRALLADAARLVRPGGVLVYATCTFAPEENEHQVAGFLATHPGWRLLDIPRHPGFAPGRPEWSPSADPDLARTVRLWPHHLRGEGHFIAKLGAPEVSGPDPGSPGPDPGVPGEDPGATWAPNPPAPPVDASHSHPPGPPVAAPHPHPPVDGAPTGRVAHGAEGGARLSTAPRARGDQGARGTQGRGTQGRGTQGRGDERAVLEAWEAFAGEALEGWPAGVVTVVGERAYRVADEEVAGAGVRLVRPGLLLGRARPGRFEPAHALAMVAGPVGARRTRPLDGAEAAAWLRGEALAHDGPGGWTVVTWEGWPLGWGRAAGGTLKNHYPKGLRTMRPAHA
jgi:16S rRNA C967 or C1407 C5-methylase (RsmB/RsmF family)/NOL1/NOP2/fmu family ribosome biogenesis protein